MSKINSVDPSSLDVCVRGQIELLCSYASQRSCLDPKFLIAHAQMIVQFAHLMGEAAQGNAPLVA